VNGQGLLSAGTDPSSHTTHGSKILRRVLDLLAIVIVLGIVFFPSIDALNRPVDERSSLREQRTPAPMPEFPQSFADFSTWMRRFDAYFRDTFGARDWLLAAHQGIALGDFLPRDPSPKIVHGREGFLYWDPGNAREVHRGARPFTKAKLETWALRIEERRAACEALGARYVFALAPAKETIYPEYMPPQFAPIGPTRYDQLAERLALQSAVTFVDMRPVMHAERAFDQGGHRTYARLGSHWTHRGAGAASRVLLAALPLQGIEPPPRESWRFVRREEPGESLADLTYVADRFREPNFGILPLENDLGIWSVTDVDGARHTIMEEGNPALPNLVLVHDSFAQWMLPFLGPHFGSIHAVGQPTLPVTLIEANQPDIVIDMFTEHVLDTWGVPPPIPTLAPQPGEVRDDQPRLARLSAERFAAYEPLAGEFDVASGSGIELRGGLRALPPSSDAKPGVEIEFTSVDSLFVIKDLTIPADREAALHMRIWSPTRCEMTLFWHTRQQVTFPRRNALTVRLRQGENGIWLALKDIVAPTALALKLANGRYRIADIEVRTR